MSNNNQPKKVNNMNNSTQKPPQEVKRPQIRRGGGPGALIPGEKARDFKGSMSQLIRYMGKHKWMILLPCCWQLALQFSPSLVPELWVRQPLSFTRE